jgi:RNA polymerase sigma-70 factor (ECF subfamily)
MDERHEIYARYAAPLYRFALALCANRADAEDLVADTFVRLWAAPGEIRHETLRAYLFTICRNLHRKRRKRAGRELPLDTQAPVLDPSQLPDERAAAALQLARVELQMAALGDIDRRALLMRTAEGRSYEEIGHALGLSSGAVRVRVHRVRAQIMKALERL